MSLYVLPVVTGLFVWWFSTGIILLLNNLPERTFPLSLAGYSAVLLAALAGLAASASDASVVGAYCAFTCGVLAWGWHEMSFFMGLVTGPRRHACHQSCGGWAHFRHGVEACLYHELAIIASAAGVVWSTWGGANHVGLWTFMILWGMRQSAKLMVFLGVLNLNEQFLPRRLTYLASFMKRRPMNLLFPFSITLGTIVSWSVVESAATAATPYGAVGDTLLATMLILGVVEHWFLVLPLPLSELWSWSIRFREERAAASVARVSRPSYASFAGRVWASAKAAVPFSTLCLQQPEVGPDSRPIGGVP